MAWSQATGREGHEQLASIPKQDTDEGSSGASEATPSRDEVLALWTPPTVHINSEFPNTVNGWLPFQVPGFNFFTRIPRGLAQWDTGTGKTVLAAGVTEELRPWADLTIWIVKVGSVENSRRALKALVGLDTWKVDGGKTKRKDGSTQRDQQYGKLAGAMARGEHPIIVTNYEKLKTDNDMYRALVTDMKVQVIVDEPSEKLRHRDSGTYRAMVEVFYTTKNPQGYPYPSAKTRPAELRMLFLDATPLRDNPEGFSNVIRMLDPSVYGSTKDFNKAHVVARDPWGRVTTYKNLKGMGDKVAPITMQIDKDDPEIAKQFPKVQAQTIYCDLAGSQEKVYDRLLREYKKLVRGTDPSILRRVDILSAINVFQMLANNPIMVLHSAHDYEAFRNEAIRMIQEGTKTDEQIGGWIKRHKKGSETAWKLWDAVGRNDMLFTDMDAQANCTVNKMNELRQLIDDHKGKLVVFSWYANLGIPRMSYWLERWGIEHVVYRGDMTLKERQAAEDDFRADPKLKVFLGSDAAGSSLNLEMADHVIHYDLPDEWAQLKQRQERVNRVTSKFEHVIYTTLVVPGTVEDRKLKLLDRKYRWHEQVLKGKVSDDAEFLRSQEELLYVLLSQGEDV